MGAEKDSGLRSALDLDRKAKALAADGRDQGEPGLLDLFAGTSVFGHVKEPNKDRRPVGGGRPKGAINRTTRDLVKLIEATGRHPIIAMAEIVATPIDVIAATLGCSPLEAAEYHRKVMSDLAPYVAQKLPTAVQISGANAGVLVVHLGDKPADEELGRRFGNVIEADAASNEINDLGDSKTGNVSHDDSQAIENTDE